MPNAKGIRTFEAIIPISGWVEGGLDDWPSHIQDGVLEAVERKSIEVALPLSVVASQCEYDVDDGYYLRVALSEVVIADERTIREGQELFAVSAPANLNLKGGGNA